MPNLNIHSIVWLSLQFAPLPPSKKGIIDSWRQWDQIMIQKKCKRWVGGNDEKQNFVAFKWERRWKIQSRGASQVRASPPPLPNAHTPPPLKEIQSMNNLKLEFNKANYNVFEWNFYFISFNRKISKCIFFGFVWG